MKYYVTGTYPFKSESFRYFLHIELIDYKGYGTPVPAIRRSTKYKNAQGFTLKEAVDVHNESTRKDPSSAEFITTEEEFDIIRIMES